MASFQAKTVLDSLRMIPKTKKLSFRSIRPRPGIGNSKKKFKKFKNIITASFQVKTGRDKLRMGEKKIIFPIHSNQTRNREFQQNSKKNVENYKTSLSLHFKLKQDWIG